MKLEEVLTEVIAAIPGEGKRDAAKLKRAMSMIRDGYIAAAEDTKETRESAGLLLTAAMWAYSDSRSGPAAAWEGEVLDLYRDKIRPLIFS